MSDKTLKQWSDDQGIRYEKAWRMFQHNEVPNGYKNGRGRIFVKGEIETDIKPKISAQIQDINYENISFASETVTRSNRVATNPLSNRFANINDGITPSYDNQSKSGGNCTGISVRDAIVLINKAYHNFAVVKNIIELLTEFSSGQIYFKGGNKKSREFFQAFSKKIGLFVFESYFFREYYRSGNVFSFIFKKKLQSDDVSKITSVYGEKSLAAKDVVIPSRFIILNPVDISVGESLTFLNPIYNKTLNSYELERLRKPLNETDQEIFDSLPADIKALIKDKSNSNVTLPLSTDDIVAVFNSKQPYEALSIPPFFGVLDDIDFKAAMRKMDVATMRLINQAILLITTGAKPEEGGINYNNLTNLQRIFANESVGRVLVSDYTTKGEFIVPPIADILDPKKYEAINNDIYVGLNYILLGDEKFANQASKIQIFVERIKHARQIFLEEFLYPIVKRMSKDLGFKNYPEPYFADIDLKNDIEWARIYTRLAEIGFLTPDETMQALENGKTPLKDESETNQEEFKSFKDKGWYEPITGGPATQKDILKEQNKQANKTQQTQLDHDDKQGNKQRKHEAENPQAPAPQIVLNAPTKLAKPNGRPAGSKRQKSTNKPRVSGASLISGAEVIKNILLADKLNKSVISSLLKKHKLKTLNQSQLEVAQGISDIIIRNEESEDWEKSIEQYIDNPIDKNIDRIDEIEELSAFHGLDTSLGAICYSSIKEG